jgi:hypothetical protein
MYMVQDEHLLILQGTGSQASLSRASQASFLVGGPGDILLTPNEEKHNVLSGRYPEILLGIFG